MLILNVLVAIAGVSVASGDSRGDYLTTMGVSIIYLVLCVPGTLFCWFLPAYHAYRYGNGLSDMYTTYQLLT